MLHGVAHLQLDRIQVFKRLLPKSENARNILTLMMGTSVAQALPIAISPILTRLYTPEDFGVLAIFVSITAIFGVIANGRYELAVMLPDRDEDALSVVVLGVLIALFLSLFLLILVILFNGDIAMILGNKEIGVWLYFVPVTVFFMGFFNALSYYSNRKRDYKSIARATVDKSFVLAGIQLLLGWIKLGGGGLILGQVASSVFSNARLIRPLCKEVHGLKVSKEAIVSVAKRYKNFPLYSMWAALASSLSVNLTNILVSQFFSLSVLGHYAFCQRVFGVPMSLVGTSISRVFYQKATQERRDFGHAKESFDGALKKLFLIGAPFFVLLFFVVEDVFGFVFGASWVVAGHYAKIMTPLFFFRFVGAALSVTNSVFEKQRVSLLWQIGLLFISLFLLFLSSYFSFSFECYLVITSLVISVYYVYLLLILRKISQGE